MKILAKIFGNEARVRLMRLFLFNPDEPYTLEKIVGRSRLEKREVNREIDLFFKIGLIKKQSIIIIDGDDKEKVPGFVLDESFLYRKQFEDLLLDTVLIKEDDLVDKLGRAGRVRFVVVAGLFLKQWDSRIDMLVVGDKLREEIIQDIVLKMEAEIGKDLRYAVLDTEDFRYRINIGDRLVRDIFDFSHKVLVDKIGL